MVSRLLFIKNLIFLRLFIKISLVRKMNTNDIKNKINNKSKNIEKLSIAELKHLKKSSKKFNR